MIRPATCSPRLHASRQYAQACRVIAKVPLRWTATTASNSSSVMETSIRSRTIPALLTTTSSRPNRATVFSTSACVPAQSVTEVASAVAVPPAATISSTTPSAGRSPPASPCRPAPTSLTTTPPPAPPGRAGPAVLAPPRRAGRGEGEAVPPPEPAPAAGHDGHLAVQHPHRRSLRSRRRISLTHLEVTAPAPAPGPRRREDRGWH